MPDIHAHICWNPNSAVPTAIKAAMQLNDRRFSSAAKMRGKASINAAKEVLNRKRAKKSSSETNILEDNPEVVI